MATPPARGLGVCLLLLLAPAVRAQGELQGWTAVLQERSGPASLGETQHVALVTMPAAAFVLAPGETLSPLLPLSPWVVGFEGEVEIEDAGRHRFGLLLEGGAGGLQVRGADGAFLVDLDAGPGVVWSEPVELPRGSVDATVVFTRGPQPAARLQVLWERLSDRAPGFGPEPIPSRFVRPIEQAFFGDGRAGRVLLELKGCTNCHAAGAAGEAVGRRAGPDLAQTGARLQPAWLRAWIEQPSALRPHADMPDLFHGLPGDAADVEHIARYLEHLVPPPDPESAGAPADGEALYHSIGCVACHGARRSQAELHGDPFLASEVPVSAPVPLVGVDQKWRRSALTEMLLDPRAVYPDGRMPALGLSRAEAVALASLLAPGPAAAPEWDGDLFPLILGRAAFERRGCAACHARGTEGAAAPSARPLVELRPEHGCLDPRDAATPRYDFAPGERELLADGLRAARAATGVPAPFDALERRIEVLGCLRCHARDGQGGAAPGLDSYFVTLEEDTDLGDEGRLPPDLSDAGFKLTTGWMEEVLTGDGRARPWIATRMPHYGAAAAGFAEPLARELGVLPHDGGREPEGTDELALAGRGLLGRSQLSCVACHVYKDFPPNGTVGPDVTRFAERLRYEWFAAYLPSPLRYKPGTRMPSFAAQDGKSTASSVLGGDLRQQIDALWACFALGADMPPPEGVERPEGLPLAVGGRPRVVRAFLEDAGARGIALGFPVGVHFAFDAERARLVSAWHGDFLDASGLWAGRGGTVAGGRGAPLWEAPPGPVLCFERDSAAAQEAAFDARALGLAFRGYDLAPGGEPVLRYALRGVEIEERVTPHAVPRPGFTRELRLARVPPGERLLFNPGPGLAGPPAVEGAGATATATPGCFLLTPSAASVVLRVEVTP